MDTGQILKSIGGFIFLLLLIAVSFIVFYIVTIIKGFNAFINIDYHTQKSLWITMLILLILNGTVIGNGVLGIPFLLLLYFVYFNKDVLKIRRGGK